MKAHETNIYVAENDKIMGFEAAKYAVERLKRADKEGKKCVMWMMAAPSGFSFYSSFIGFVESDESLRNIVTRTSFFQFDDYPIARGDDRFPITFRSLLETSFFTPLEKVVKTALDISYLELRGDDSDDSVAEDYQRRLLGYLEDDSCYVLEVKGIGMDGHWGFHGSETPLDVKPMIMKVPMNELNIQQQMIDWPQYFAKESDVPSFAYTASVPLFMKADTVIDLVPQQTKAFAVLACYGIDAPSQSVPSSMLITHRDSHSFLTEQSAWALIKYRKEQVLSNSVVKRLNEIWVNEENPQLQEHNQKMMERILRSLF